jgi:hypothetical protein
MGCYDVVLCLKRFVESKMQKQESRNEREYSENDGEKRIILIFFMMMKNN